jgi:hypothetical protein
MRYLKRPTAVEAERFDGSIEDARRITLLCGGDVTLETGTYGKFTGRLIVHTREGRRVADAGDFVVTDAFGQRSPYHPTVFHAMYRAAPEGD